MKRNLHAGKRHSGGFSLNIFSDDELYEIHLATLEVLQETGVFVEELEALEIFDGGGAHVDGKKKIVRIAKEFGIEPATPNEARQILVLKGLSEDNF